MIKLSGLISQALSYGSAGSTIDRYDYIKKLPTLFSFDLANGWWGEVCEDSNSDDRPVTYTVRRDDNWDEEYTDTYVCTKTTKVRYVRFFKDTELQLVSGAVGSTDRYAEWYAANVNSIGGLKTTIAIEYVYTGSISMVGTYDPEHLLLPYVYFDYKYTEIENGIITYESTGASALIYERNEFIYKNFDDINLSVYDEFVKAVRKFSDEYNNSSVT